MKKIIEAKGINRDPSIVSAKGSYYHCHTAKDETGRSAICIVEAKQIDDFGTAEGKIVYVFESGKEYSCEVWAPELHIIDGKCYIYAACDDGNNHHHRMYVLCNDSADPMQPYQMRGKITDSTDRWAIDGTVMKYCGELYFIWSGWEENENVAQNLYIAHMKDPCTIDSERVIISRPEKEWEKRGATGEIESPFINEGPFAFSFDGKQYIAYSASGSWCEDYCIALLELCGDDPMKEGNWHKQSAPVMSRNTLAKGCGHCSILKEKGKLMMFFHAWDADETVIRWNTVSTWMAELVPNGHGFEVS